MTIENEWSATGGSAVRLVAPAKLTLSLRITGIRDDGFHLIDAEMVSLDLHDVLEVMPRHEIASPVIVVEGEFSAHVPTDSSNLVWRALELVERTAEVRITKQIPHGGGLGGGSADAAAILRWAGHDDVDSAARIGADVPFCVHGGRARVRGIGEIIEPLPFVERALTVLVPPLAVATIDAYRAWDDLGGPTGHPSGNDLEPAAVSVVPELGEWKRRISEAAGIEPTLAGSGASWFLDGHHPDLQKTLPTIRVILANTVPA